MSTHCPGCYEGVRARSIKASDDIADFISVHPCPGCPECADAAEWHEAIMAETCGEDERHCACVPVLRKACADRDARIKQLEIGYDTLKHEITKRDTKIGVLENEICTARDHLPIDTPEDESFSVALIKMGDDIHAKDAEIARLTAKLKVANRERADCFTHAVIAIKTWKDKHDAIAIAGADAEEERDALQDKLEAVGELVAAVEEYLIAPATTGPQRLREALGKYITTRTP